MKLNARQETFCQHYVVGGNGADAAIKAGYAKRSARQQASEMLGSVMVKARVAELKAARVARVEIDADWVLTQLKDIAVACKKTSPPNAIRALELLGKHVGLFIDKPGEDAAPPARSIQIFRALVGLADATS